MSPAKSKAQVRKLGALAREGKISEETFQEWLRKTPNIKGLPERARKKKGKREGKKSGD